MTDWLAAATARFDWTGNPLLAGRGTPWTRRWASVVLEQGFPEQQASSMPYYASSPGNRL
jgi:hypothetical protein